MARIKIDDWLTPENLTRLEAWARDGLTNEQIAHNMGVGIRTLYKWQQESVQFMQALKKGREVVDIEVENALLKRAKGYTYKETMVEDGPDGKKRRVTTKHVPADVGAAVFWLKNRRPDKWRDKPVYETESATLSKARELLGGIPSVINGHRPSPDTKSGAGYAPSTQALTVASQAKPDLEKVKKP